ncbi:hypothetical protein PHLCEN_2v1247 [Hermanssonia centrifuga]|uniref:Uncharacterized protein n=1 Tax=Hermanssonia centrifuga TaxID=98765 RepID=A0A2R6S3N1_9APHY|nr:hypothetical protein PHLCEN_2v1247 [Hermanssonia centrifuga]
MLPRFANPHFLNQSTQIVSRADLDNIRDVIRHEPEEDDDGIVATLETLVKRSLGDFQVMSAKQENTSPERKRKRRKIESDDGKDDAQAATEDEVVCAL